MKVISIKEPFATLIKEGIKKIETRSFKTKYRGEIYIHASLTKEDTTRKGIEFNDLIKDLEFNPGYILCKANLVDCIEFDEKFVNELKENNYNEYICGGFSLGRYGWILDNIEVIEPIKVKGQLGIWNYYDKDNT